jgi:hypothetical protein
MWPYAGEAMERSKKEMKELSPIAGLGQEAFQHRDKKFEYVQLFVKRGMRCWRSDIVDDAEILTLGVPPVTPFRSLGYTQS